MLQPLAHVFSGACCMRLWRMCHWVHVPLAVCNSASATTGSMCHWQLHATGCATGYTDIHINR